MATAYQNKQLLNKFHPKTYSDGRFGVVVGILAYYATVTGSIPAQCKHLCAWTCLFVLGLGVSMYNMYVFTKKMYISMY
jgi:hypothetical protein